MSLGFGVMRARGSVSPLFTLYPGTINDLGAVDPALWNRFLFSRGRRPLFPVQRLSTHGIGSPDGVAGMGVNGLVGPGVALVNRFCVFVHWLLHF